MIRGWLTQTRFGAKGRKFGQAAKTAPRRDAEAGLRTLRFRHSSYQVDATLVRGFIDVVQPSLVVDQVRKTCWIRGKEYSMRAQDTLLSIFACFVRHQGIPLSVDRLHREVWGRSMTSPGLQKGKVHFQLHRMRAMLSEAMGIDNVAIERTSGYTLSSEMSCLLVEQAPQRRKRPTETAVLDVVRELGYIDNRTYRERLGVTGSGARWGLVALVQNKTLSACGRGRATHYHLPGTPCSHAA